MPTLLQASRAVVLQTVAPGCRFVRRVTHPDRRLETPSGTTGGPRRSSASRGFCASLSTPPGRGQPYLCNLLPAARKPMHNGHTIALYVAPGSAVCIAGSSLAALTRPQSLALLLLPQSLYPKARLFVAFVASDWRTITGAPSQLSWCL